MYLKNLELVGFKSFANRTKLEFGPGMTAVVGLTDAEKAMFPMLSAGCSGNKAPGYYADQMEDCIFNGTDKRKPW